MNVKISQPIIDAKFLSLIHKAEFGDTEAIWDLVSVFNLGIGTKVDLTQLKYYLSKLAALPDKLTKYQYGGVLSSLGDVTFDLRNYDQAADLYMKAIHHFRESFSEVEAKELIDYYEVEKNLERAFFWTDKIKELIPESQNN